MIYMALEEKLATLDTQDTRRRKT